MDSSIILLILFLFTTIGHDSEIGGNVWLKNSVPPFSRVYNKPPAPVIKTIA